MKLLFIHILFISTRYVFGAKDVDGYFELDNLLKEAYLCSDSNCGRTYICKNQNIIVICDDLYNCYYRSEYVDDLLGYFDRQDPNKCAFKGEGFNWRIL